MAYQSTSILQANVCLWSGTSGKKSEVVSGTTDSNGLVTLTFTKSYLFPPFVLPVVVGMSTEQFIRVVSVSNTQCQIHVYQRNSLTLLSVNLLSFATTNVNNTEVSVLIIEK